MFPDHKARIANLQSVMSKTGLKAAVVTSRGSLLYFADIFSQFRSALVFGQTGDPTLITNKNDVERMGTITSIKEILGWDFTNQLEFNSKIVSALRDRGVDKDSVGVELETGQVAGVLTAKELIDIKEALPGIVVKNILYDIYELMVVKDSYEIEQLRRAAEIADVGMEAAFKALRPGISELAIYGVIEHAMYTAGNMCTWAYNEIGSGYRQRYALNFVVVPSNKLVQFGDVVTLDVHPSVSGYQSDFSLNAVVGPPTDPVRRLADAWEEIVQILIDALKSERTAHDVACIVESAVQKRKVDAFTCALLGHGLGTEARIPPTIVKGSKRVLKPRMIVEAALQITDPSIAGLRLEVPVLLTETGNEVLCKTPLKLHVCG